MGGTLCKIGSPLLSFLLCSLCTPLQYSVYAKLCINNDSAKTIQKRLKNNVPDNGDIRYLIITERQYQNIVNMNSNYTLQENITTTDRTLIIGGLNSENNT